MKPSEMATLIGMIQEIWPTFLNGRNIVRTTELWHELFAEETFDEMLHAIRTYACRDDRGFPPPIGMLKKLVWQQRNEQISEQSAWEIVKAQFCGSSAHPTENFSKLPELVQKCVGSPSTLMKWGQMGEDELESVIASNFRRAYRESVQQKRECDVLPPSLRVKYREYALPTPDAEAHRLPVPEPKDEYVPCPAWVKDRVHANCEQAEQEGRNHGAFCNRPRE